MLGGPLVGCFPGSGRLGAHDGGPVLAGHQGPRGGQGIVRDDDHLHRVGHSLQPAQDVAELLLVQAGKGVVEQQRQRSPEAHGPLGGQPGEQVPLDLLGEGALVEGLGQLVGRLEPRLGLGALRDDVSQGRRRSLEAALGFGERSLCLRHVARELFG